MKSWVSILLNVAVAAVGVLQATDWVNLVGSDTAGAVATGIAVLNMVLHYFVKVPARGAGTPAAQ
jgi:hypothetical protein